MLLFTHPATNQRKHLSLHDALPISGSAWDRGDGGPPPPWPRRGAAPPSPRRRRLPRAAERASAPAAGTAAAAAPGRRPAGGPRRGRTPRPPHGRGGAGGGARPPVPTARRDRIRRRTSRYYPLRRVLVKSPLLDLAHVARTPVLRSCAPAMRISHLLLHPY